MSFRGKQDDVNLRKFAVFIFDFRSNFFTVTQFPIIPISDNKNNVWFDFFGQCKGTL